MHLDIVTIFPKMFAPVLGESIMKRAQASGIVSVVVHNLRDYTHDKRRTVDDRPYGGGPGMVLKPEPVFEAVDAIETARHSQASPRPRHGCEVILMSPGGIRLTQAMAQELGRLDHLVVLCGHYEGVDERIRQALVDREVSIGDYVLTGGELPAMVLIDCLVRLMPGVVGHPRATHEESFADGLLEYPHYTRPAVFRGMEVPEALRDGSHERVTTWRKLQAVARTWRQRPDLVKDSRLPGPPRAPQAGAGKTQDSSQNRSGD
jgi:tRNA (guanine37-N1)-methyltransferase